MVREPRVFQNGFSGHAIEFLSGHPTLQYFITFEHISSSCWAWRYLSNVDRDAGKEGMVIAGTKHSAWSCMVVSFSENFGKGARESASAV